MKKYKVSFVRIVEANNENEAKERAIEDSCLRDTPELEGELYVEELKHEKEN